MVDIMRAAFFSFLFIFVFPASLIAQVYQATRTTSIYNQASSNSMSFYTMRSGDLIIVDATKGQWLQVRVKQKGKVVKGFVPKREKSSWRLYRKSQQGSQKKAVKTKPPAQPSSSPKTSAQANSSASNSHSDDDISYQKLPYEIGLGYSLYNYKLSSPGNGAGDLFSYNLGGVGLNLIGRIPYSTTDKSWIGLQIELLPVLYFTKTDLQDFNFQTFETRNSRNISVDAKLRFLTEFSLGTSIFKKLGLNVGAEWFQFFGDDISSDFDEVGLYVDHRVISFFAGPSTHFRIPKFENFSADLGIDVLIYNLLKEKPANQTGTSPSADMGYAANLALNWHWKENSLLKLAYQLRWQNFNFTGGGVRANSAVDDAEVRNVINFLSLAYEFKL